jgi:hypothetical protein
MIKRRIGWQKYEDMLESQLDSPLFDTLLSKSEELNQDQYIEGSEELRVEQDIIIPVDEKMMENIILTSNFDCWMAHTNFNLTPETKSVLNKIDGVEILKICSRYRFFIGIGKMFDFNDVRYSIEQELESNSGEKADEN